MLRSVFLFSLASAAHATCAKGACTSLSRPALTAAAGSAPQGGKVISSSSTRGSSASTFFTVWAWTSNVSGPVKSMDWAISNNVTHYLRRTYVSASNAKPVGPAQAPIVTGTFSDGLLGFITPVSFAVDLSGVPRGEQVHLTISNLQGSRDPFAATYVSMSNSGAEANNCAYGYLEVTAPFQAPFDHCAVQFQPQLNEVSPLDINNIAVTVTQKRVVVFDNGGTDANTVLGSNGATVSPNTPAAFAKCLQQVASNDPNAVCPFAITTPLVLPLAPPKSPRRRV